MSTTTYKISYPPVANPQFTPVGGVYYSGQTVALSCTTTGAVIYYTTDGTDPSPSSILYTDPIAISGEGPAHVKAYAVMEGHSDSQFVTSSYMIILHHIPEWGRTAGAYENAEYNATATDSASNIYAVGSIQNSSNILTKYSTDGEVLWSIQITATSDCSFYSLAIDTDGNIYVVGGFDGNEVIDFGNGITVQGLHNGAEQPLLVKYNPQGIPQWVKTATSDLYTQAHFNAVVVDSAGEIYSVGEMVFSGIHDFGNGVTAESKSTGVSCVLVKYNSDGEPQWACSEISGQGNTSFRGIALDNDQNVYTCGYQSGVSDFGNNVTVDGSASQNILCVKYSTDSTPLWARTVVSGAMNSILNSISVDTTGDVYAVGQMKASASTEKTVFYFGNGVYATSLDCLGAPLLIKYDSAGTPLWARTTLSHGGGMYYGIICSSDGTIFIDGVISDNTIFNFGDEVYIQGGYYNHPIVIKYNSFGEVCWAQSLLPPLSTSNGIFKGIGLDTNNNLIAVGRIFSTLDFGHGVILNGSGRLIVKYRY